MTTERLTLLQLNRLVRETLELSMPGEYWVEAELSEVREHAGHCYMELIEKEPRSNTPVAKASAKCWRSTWGAVRTHFVRVTGQSLAPGMKVLLLVAAQFHENYGFSWIVSDIDPTYTLGDMARKRQEIIRRLKADGVFYLNKELPLPMFAQSIAVISSAGAAGYGDFCHQLANNDRGLRFNVRLFTAIMQGEGVEQSVIAALDAINAAADDFDCVVIIRGGGATSDLTGFDTLALAENVANFPLPIITGIGHERDESVLDMVAHTSVKTPTAAATFLIDNLKQVVDVIDRAQLIVTRTVSERLALERLRLTRLSANIPAVFSLYGHRQLTALTVLSERMRHATADHITKAGHTTDMLSARLRSAARTYTTAATHRVNLLAQRTEALDPKHILRRGYSITLCEGRCVRDADSLAPGTRLTTRLSHGEVTSEVI